jgi:hypothetical protein
VEHKYTVWAKCRITESENNGTDSYHCNKCIDVTVKTNNASPTKYNLVMFVATVCEYCCHSSAVIVGHV